MRMSRSLDSSSTAFRASVYSLSLSSSKERCRQVLCCIVAPIIAAIRPRNRVEKNVTMTSFQRVRFYRLFLRTKCMTTGIRRQSATDTVRFECSQKIGHLACEGRCRHSSRCNGRCRQIATLVRTITKVRFDKAASRYSINVR
jgi:hypothetical protein